MAPSLRSSRKRRRVDDDPSLHTDTSSSVLSEALSILQSETEVRTLTLSLLLVIEPPSLLSLS